MKLNRLKVVVITPGLLPRFGGSSISEASLCQALRAHCKIRVLCRRGFLDYDFAKSYGLYAIKQFGALGVIFAWLFRMHWINHELRDAQVVHINGHWKWENYFWARLCVREKIPYVLHPRGMFLLGHRRVVLKKVFNFFIGNFIIRHAAKVIALSQFEIRHFSRQPIASDKVEIIPNGIHLPEHVATLDRNLSIVGPYFLYLGRVEPRKNLLYLIDQFAEYRRMGGETCLLLMGPVERGYDRVIARRLKYLQLQDSVKLYAAAYGLEKWAHLRAAVAVLYPTLEEPFGRVPFEAVLAGTPAVVPVDSGSAEYLSPYLADCIYDPKSAGNPVANVLARLEGEEAVRIRGGVEKARNWVRDNLDWSRVSARVFQLYESISGTKEPFRASA